MVFMVEFMAGFSVMKIILNQHNSFLTAICLAVNEMS